MAQLLARGADFIGEARCRGRLYLVRHYPGLVLSDDADDVVYGELFRLRQPAELLREFDMYEACGEGFSEPTEYVRQMLAVTREGEAAGSPACRASPRDGSFWRGRDIRRHSGAHRRREPGISRFPDAQLRIWGPRLRVSRNDDSVRRAFSAWPSAACRSAARR
jgi:hypothetical protein